MSSLWKSENPADPKCPGVTGGQEWFESAGRLWG